MPAKKTPPKLIENLKETLHEEKRFFHVFSIHGKMAALVWNNRGEISRFFLPVMCCSDLENIIQKAFPKAKKRRPTEEISLLLAQIKSYFEAKPCKLEWEKFDLQDQSDFAKKVFSVLREVEYGTTISYKDLARKSGKPSAARAIGRIVGKNPVPLLIPCHRVIKTDGSAGGFSAEGGISQKIEMLALEGIKLPKKTLEIDTTSINNDDEIETAIKAISQADPDLAVWIKKLPRFTLAPTDNTTTFQALLEAIVYQQLTAKAAGTIYARLLNLFGGFQVAPLDIMRARDSELRSAGLSRPKILAIRDLAEKCLAGNIPDMQKLSTMSDDEIVGKLVNIRGIGRWTAEMLLIFKLGRLDVLPIDDYGIKKGLAILRNCQKLPSPQQIAHEGRIWQPFRTIVSWYLWRIAESVKQN